jgi:pseudaminic acid cytidylyltransferase
MSNVAIITARGGSKRIPRKNIRPFLGKPIIAYVIEAALQSGLFDEVMVSTDDGEIAAIARQYGASVPFMRSPQNSDDYANTVDVLLEVLETYKAQGRFFESVCCLYPTAPFVTKEILSKTYQVLVDRKVALVYPLQRFHFPIQRAFFLQDDIIRWADPDSFLKRSQDLETAYHDAGQFYWFDSAQLMAHRQLAGLQAGGVEISEMQAHDIDSEEDWRIAEFKYQILLNNQERA